MKNNDDSIPESLKGLSGTEHSFLSSILYLDYFFDLLEKEEAFEKNVADKGEVVEKILRLDEGFNSVFNRIKEELQTNKGKYAKDIEHLKELVASVTDLGVRIQAQELRNKQLVEKRFAQMRKELSQAKRTTSTANAYYKNVNNLNQYESHFLDQKK